MHYQYGWRPQLPDHRDYLSPLYSSRPLLLPAAVDLRPTDCAIFDQGELGSCTANAICGLIDYQLQRQGVAAVVTSRLFVYYNERAMEGTVQSDAGAAIRDGMKSVNKMGVCSEDQWPYVRARFTHKPTPPCYTEAAKHTATDYQALGQSVVMLKECLASGQQFVFGFSVYESFESDEVARTGVVHMPGRAEKMLGGHAVRCVGYNDAKAHFIIANSWGTEWGDKGYFYLPYNYVVRAGLASDFWTISAVSG